jgi:S-DNA-T family DNA segregation ATPase FtsK/SpoIIIE
VDKNYKILLTNKKIYKEVELADTLESLRVGTGAECDVRLRKDLFFEQFDIDFYVENDRWHVRCSDNIYISDRDVRKLLTCELRHGDEIALKYNSTGNDLIAFTFALDFERSQKNYDREIDISQISHVHIGAAAHCDIYCHEPLLAGAFMTIQRRGGDYFLIDNDTEYGVYLDGNRIHGEAPLSNFDFISMAEFSFYFKHRKLYCSAGPEVTIEKALTCSIIVPSKSSFTYPKFNRSSRVKPKIPEEALTILDPPAKPQKQSTNILMSLLPMLGMVAVVVLMRGSAGGGNNSYIWMSVAMMSMGGITSVGTFISSRRKHKKDTRERIEKYNAYIESKREEFAQCRQDELSLLNEIYRSQETNICAVFDFSGALFDRTKEDEDFLFVKAGAGVREAIRKIDYKKKESFSTDDELESLPETVSEEYRFIENAPITVDINAHNAIGIVGDWKSRYDLLKNFTIDIAARHYYKDVRVFHIVDERYTDIFRWLRFLPHLNNQQMNSRNIAYDADSKVAIYEYLYKELTNRESVKGEYSHFVIFVFDNEGFRRHPISKFVEQASEINTTFVFFDSDIEQLPLHCDEIITIHEDGNAHVLSCNDRNNKFDFMYDAIDDKLAEQLVLKLSPIYCEEVSLESSLTKNISLFELLHIFGVEDLDLNVRWGRSQVTKTMAAPLGVKTKNEVVALDLHEKAHGPHGLVAGTTGSGKSEILQSYILSAATLFHPYDIAFVIIDFKGGGMVNQFKDLPHLVGSITNIDGKEIDRSLLSIKAELTKRQNLFAEADVNHIDKYITKYKNREVSVALPHLVIIVDEFAELKAEQPEFMAELISAARIGRSLGVHLILATQKPAGQVNEQIWSNSRFKLCLKVQTREDSNEVLKSPLAAEILEPGRAYFQVGNNEIFELFQSAYSGSPEKVESDGSISKSFHLAAVDLAGRRKVVYAQKPDKGEEETKTQLSAIVEYVNKYCEQNGIAKLPDICLPPLPISLSYPGEKKEVSATQDYIVGVGIYDDPRNQYQGLAEIDIAAGNTMIIGSAQYGKTNLLQSMIRSLVLRFSPDEVNIYILDFASMVLKTFESLHHVGGVVTSSEDEKLKNLFKLLGEEIAVRKEKLVSVGVSSFSAYREAGFADMPLIILMVDNLTMLKELYLQEDDFLLGICREGISVGVSVVVSNAQTAGIGYRYLANFANRLALYNNDSGEYNNLFDYCKMQPENLPGRCIIDIDKTLYEAQTFLAFEGEKEIDRVNETRAFIDEQNALWSGRKAKRIPEIPRVLYDDYLSENFTIGDKPYDICVGLNYDTVEPVNFNFEAMGLLGIVAADNLCKYEFAKRIVNKLLADSKRAPVQINIIDDFERGFGELATADANIGYSTVHTDILKIIADYDKKLSERYEQLAQGDRLKLNGQSLLLLLINSIDAIKDLSGNSDAMVKFKDIISRYKSLKVAIICSAIDNAPIAYSSPEALKTFKSDGIFLYYGNLDGFKVSDPPYAELKRFKKPVERGDAYCIRENAVEKIKTVAEENR